MIRLLEAPGPRSDDHKLQFQGAQNCAGSWPEVPESAMSSSLRLLTPINDVY
jgi:hypothetical protein